MSDLSHDAMTRVCAQLEWFGLDCMLLTSKATRAAAYPFVRAVARKNAVLKQCAHMLARMVCDFVPRANEIESLAEQETFDASALVVTHGGVTWIAIIDTSRIRNRVTAHLLEDPTMPRAAHGSTVIELFVTDVPSTGYANLRRERDVQRIEFATVPEARDRLESAWRAACGP